MTQYSHVREEVFYIDGSLRDIYVLETNEQDWQELLNFLHLEMYPVDFSVGGEPQPLPQRCKDIFVLTQKHGVTVNLCIDEEQLALHCHFFTPEQIEFDLNPGDFHQEHQVFRLLDFIRTIGKLLKKEIILTPENMPTIPLFRFDPVADKEEWFFTDGSVSTTPRQTFSIENVSLSPS